MAFCEEKPFFGLLLLVTLNCGYAEVSFCSLLQKIETKFIAETHSWNLLPAVCWA